MRDLGPLAGLAKLEILGLGSTRITDLKPLMGLATSLQSLDIHGTAIDCVTQVADIQALVARGVIVSTDCAGFGPPVLYLRRVP